jgi:thioredoxin 1
MKEITSAQFDSEVLAASVPVIVDFYTEQCNPCRQLAPMLGELEQETAGKLKVVKIDASADGRFTAAFGVTVVPTLILFHQGQRQAQITGLRSKREMAKWLAESLPPK